MGKGILAYGGFYESEACHRKDEEYWELSYLIDSN